MDLREQYLERANDDVLQAAALLTVDLMRGDPTEFKAGYTFHNAVWAACDVYAMTAISLVAEIGYRVAKLEQTAEAEEIARRVIPDLASRVGW